MIPIFLHTHTHTSYTDFVWQIGCADIESKLDLDCKLVSLTIPPEAPGKLMDIN